MEKRTHTLNGKFAPGNNMGGRKKGQPNKTTKEVREAYQAFVEGQMGNVESWFERVAKDKPDRALDLMLQFSEYFIPKLARRVDEDGNDIKEKVFVVKL